MSKKSKVPEKPSRTPDVNEAGKELAVQEYLRQLGGINTESAKSHRFTLLLQALFGVEPGFIEKYVAGIEKFLKMEGKDRIVRGEADQLSGNLIIEFENDLTSKAKLEEAEGQLRQYTACAWSQEPPGKRTRFVCLASDGRRFRAYAPVAKQLAAPHPEPEGIDLGLLDDIDAAKLDWKGFYFFLDRYLLRKEILHPTSEAIVRDFGPTSHAFRVAEAALLARWGELKDHPDYAVLYGAWDKYLRIVYGSALADHELFVRHTYLATLAKLMVWSRLAGRDERPTDADIVAILEGSYFKQQLRLENFLEEDFFSWVARKEARAATLSITRPVLELLRNYHLREISEDVLKSLYEGLVDPATRHDLGEFYTPDWLADRIVRKMLAPNPGASVLDPACGSGTFLYMAIREKRRLLGDSAKTLKHILSAIVGMDIHPLACIIAKANYVLALGDLMTKRKEKVGIPVYLANSIRPPELQPVIAAYKVEIDDHMVNIPESLIKDTARYDQAIEAARDFAAHSKGKKVAPDVFRNFLRANYPDLIPHDEAPGGLLSVAEVLKDMVNAGRDTIWGFVLKNIYKPLFFNEEFDLVIGNPPWLSYRYVERSDYQRFLKKQITKDYELVKNRAELVTQMDLGTLFLVRSAHLYLREGGCIGFVLPKSIFGADQHDALRRGNIQQVVLRTTELWDLEAVSPLFNISAGVFFGQKVREQQKTAPVPGQILQGELPVRNPPLDVAANMLASSDVKFSLSEMGTRSYWTTGAERHVRASHYRHDFRVGATIFPRCFWFVHHEPSPLGFDASVPFLVSAQRAQKEAKPAYKGCVIRGPVDSRFLYATLLSADMVPFGHLRLRPVVLPVLPKLNAYDLCTADDAREAGFIHLAEWLDKVQAEWEKRRGDKAKAVGSLDSLDWLNYGHKLTRQNPRAPLRVIYGTSGTHVCACSLSRSQAGKGGPHGLHLRGFVADYTTYQLETSDGREASYLVAVLNAPVVNAAIKGSQARGLWGARHICTKVLDLPIPKFDEKVKEHPRLAEIGEACAKRVQEWIDAGGPGSIQSIGLLRGRVRVMLASELAEIDSIVKPMLGT